MSFKEMSYTKKILLVTAIVFIISLFVCPAVKAQAAPAAPNCNIVYDFGGGRTFTVDSNTAMALMVTNPDGSYAIDPNTQYYMIDPAKLLSFLNALQIMYPSTASDLNFYATNGGLVYVAPGRFSTYTKRFLNVPRDMAYLPQAIMEKRNEIHVPEMSVGNTYIEIDISDQTLYYYENLALKFTTPVVTGNASLGHHTPRGIFYVRAKQRSVTLTGSNYRSYVNYWMPIVGNMIGIHDATWRSSFGGNIYLTNGSHGCINVPLANEAELFNMVQTGTPVVVHE